MDKKLISIFVCLLFSLMFVSAAPPVTSVSLGDETLDIQTPLFTSLQQNEDLHLRFHVYNKSNGVLFNNSWIDCEYHIYRPNNTAGDGMNGDTVAGGDHCHKIDVDGGNFTELGNYFYFVHCNNTHRGGYAEGQFTVTTTGFELTESKAIVYILLFMVFIFLFVINILGIKQLPDSNSKDEDGVIIKISYLKYLRPVLWFVSWMFIVGILYISSNIAFAYLEATLFANFLFMLFRITFGLTLPLVVVWFIWIFARIIDDKNIRKLWERGMFSGGKL